MRLDCALVELLGVESRNKAQMIIKAGGVNVNGKIAKKTSLDVSVEDDIDIQHNPCPWVSRAGLKLAYAIEHFAPKPLSGIALDIGASTGGFTDVLLQYDFDKIYAIDVGSNQLHKKIRENDRVDSMENTDARLIRYEMTGNVDCIVADVSFVSITKVISASLDILKQGGWAIFLIKPQFEVGRQNIGKGGIVKPSVDMDSMVQDIITFFKENNMTDFAYIPSPIKGNSGNSEFLLYTTKIIS